MSAPFTTTTTAPVRTAVQVTLTVVVGDDNPRVFAAEGVALDDSNPYRLAGSMTHSVADDAIDALMDHER